MANVMDADRKLKDLPLVIGSPPTQFILEFRKLQSGTTALKTKLQLEADSKLVGFLASNHEITREKKAQRGLSSAIEQARSNNLACRDPFASFVDKTILAIRNNLVHPSSHGVLHESIPIPAESDLVTLEQLMSRPALIPDLLRWLVELINLVYTAQQPMQNNINP